MPASSLFGIVVKVWLAAAIPGAPLLPPLVSSTADTFKTNEPIPSLSLHELHVVNRQIHKGLNNERQEKTKKKEGKTKHANTTGQHCNNATMKRCWKQDKESHGSAHGMEKSATSVQCKDTKTHQYQDGGRPSAHVWRDDGAREGSVHAHATKVSAHTTQRQRHHIIVQHAPKFASYFGQCGRQPR